jgi:hypothetical protein
MATAPQPTITVTLTYSDPRLDDEEREALALNLYQELRSAGEFGEVRRVTEVAPPGSKSISAQVIGALAAIVSATSLKAFFAYLSERWRGRQITVEIDFGKNTIKLVANSQEDLVLAHNTAANLLNAPR